MFSEPWPLDGWPDMATRVLVPRDDRLFPLAFQRRVARERLGLEIDQIPGGHVPMLSRPGELWRGRRFDSSELAQRRVIGYRDLAKLAVAVERDLTPPSVASARVEEVAFTTA